MRYSISDTELDQQLRAMMMDGGEEPFALDKKRVFGGAVCQAHRRKRFRLLAASLVILLITAFAIPPVRAAIGRLFTFIPGIGIVEKGEDVIYTVNPIVSQAEAGKSCVVLGNAIYSNGHLNVHVEAKNVYYKFDDITFRKNGEVIERAAASSSWGGMVYGYSDTLYKMDAPEPEDVFALDIAGFPNALSFTMRRCEDHMELAEIGPTDTQNGISITAISRRTEEGLTVWCYPFNPTDDKVLGIGEPYMGVLEDSAYIETESGYTGTRVNREGFRVMERLTFDMPAGDSAATLHVPYLDMGRVEKIKFTVPVPTEYGVMESDISIECSLGTIRITSIERKPNEYGSDKPDQLGMYFAFESAESDKVFHSFGSLSTGIRIGRHGSSGYMRRFNEETYCLEYLQTEIEDGAKKMTFTIDDLSYYQLGEYVIPLELP